MRDFFEVFGFIAAVVFLIFIGGYFHESDLMRHCDQENTMHTWGDYGEIYCEVKSRND